MSDKEGVPRSRLRRFWARLSQHDSPKEAAEEALEGLEEDGYIDPDEREAMEGILDLDETTAREILVPRTEIAYVDKTATLTEIIACMVESGHSRIPVVEGNLDRTLGFVHVKDLLPFWGREAEFAVEKILRQPYVVPESKKLDELLEELQARREQIALVIDEFGGVSGLVSIEDILEEVVGEISDEHDKEEHKVFFKDAATLVAPGRFDMYDFCEHFGLEEPDGQFNTIGGWIFERIGRVPKSGETLELDGFTVKIEAATERQIRRVRIQRTQPPAVE
jgi:magnesium and cobalt transporter